MSLRQIDALKAGLHAVSPSLYLAVGANGGRSWIFRYRSPTTGKRRDLGLGSATILGRDEAAEAVRRHRLAVLDGHDPIEGRRANEIDKGLSVTFEQATIAYYNSHVAVWTKDHARKWLGEMSRFVFPVFGKLPIDKVTRKEVLAAIKPCWEAKVHSAPLNLKRIERVIDTAVALGQRQDGRNPATWKGALETILPPYSQMRTVEHHAAMDYMKVPSFVAQVLNLSDESFGSTTASNNGKVCPVVDRQLLAFTILTAIRKTEGSNAVWSEFDLDARTWVIPAARMKGKPGKRKEHHIPLSAPAMAILQDRPRGADDDLVFPITHRDAVLRLIRRTAGDVTLHGFRTCFSTWAGERTNHPRDIVERCLSHSTGGAVEQAYRRGNEIERRRVVMDGWARFVMEPEAQGNVVVDLKRAQM